MRFLTMFYDGLIKAGNKSQFAILAVTLLALRVVWGFEFFQSGLAKWHDMSGVISYFQSLPIRSLLSMRILLARWSWLEVCCF